MVERAFYAAVKRLLTDPVEGLLLAVSGGVDSMVMANLFIGWITTPEGNRICSRVAIAHMNFSLRGEESDRDSDFVDSWAKKNHISFFRKTVSARDYADKKGISLEMAARELRYQWFEILSQKERFTYTAIAHNANDKAETLLLNLIRGTGVRGLCSMREKTGSIIRPLLDVPRSTIEDYARVHDIPFRTDSTNLETDFARNKIRHLVMPVLEEISPNVAVRFAKNSGLFLQAQQVLDSYVREKRDECSSERGFSIPALLNQEHMNFLLHEFLSPYGFNSSQTESIALAMAGQSGKHFFSESHILWIDRGELVIRDVVDSGITPGLTVKQMERTPGFVIPNDPQTAALDGDMLVYPLTIRKWEPGDKFIPLGMTGFKKISDFLTDLKIPLYNKEKVHLLCSGNDVVWVIGYRIDNRYRITPATTTIMLFHQKADGPEDPGLPTVPVFDCE
ncbi:MAG TPA: tRNA lysidine(34) synthetase TilS [Bacteroidales bacterium]|nr:tRNA lysidine(34) synthetase TilS [Bacteroidales bacterium]